MSGQPLSGTDSAEPWLPPFPAVRGWLVFSSVAGLALLCTIAMLGSLGWRDQLAPAVATGLVCYGAALAAFEPVRRAARRSAQAVPVAAFLAMAIRLAGSLLGVGLLVLARVLAPVPAAGWMLGWYLLLLVVEVVILVRYLRQWSPSPGGAQSRSLN